MPSTFTSGLRLEKIASGEQNNTWGDTGNANLDRIDAGTAWRTVNTVDFSSTLAVVQFTLPAGIRRARIEFQNVIGPIPTSLYARFSFDGGATLANGPTDYAFASTALTSTNTQIPYGAQSSALIMTPPSLAPNALAVFGDIDIDMSRRSCLWRVQGGQADGTVLVVMGGGFCSVAGTLGAVVMGLAGTSLSSGQFKLLVSA